MRHTFSFWPERSFSGYLLGAGLMTPMQRLGTGPTSSELAPTGGTTDTRVPIAPSR